MSGACAAHRLLDPGLVPVSPILRRRGMQGNFTNGWAYTFVLLVTFWILFSYLVPISLFVTLEIVKFWQVRGMFS